MANGRTRRRYQKPVWGSERITSHDTLICDQLQGESLNSPVAARYMDPFEGNDWNRLIPAYLVMDCD